MIKLVALYKQPDDAMAFEEAYFSTHIPLIHKVPGLLDIKFTHFTRTLVGEPYYMMAEMYFQDKEMLKAGLRSPEMAAAGENLDSFAKGQYTLMFGLGKDEVS